MGEESNEKIPTKRKWLDYFDVFKYFIPFLVYFIVVWLDSNYASNADLAQVSSDVAQNAVLIEKSLESSRDLENNMGYEIKLIDQKLNSIVKTLDELKKIVEENHKTN